MPLEDHRLPLPDGGVARVLVSGRADGDLRVDGPPAALDARRTQLVDRPWIWLRQVHGATVVDGDAPDAAGREADAVVTTRDDVALAVHTADCVPIALVGDGALGAVHAGWRGLLAGVVEAAVDAVRARGATEVQAVVGPCICAECYEFGATELDAVAARYGDGVRATTAAGTPALDLRAAAARALEAAGVGEVVVSPRCTASSPDELYSHRARHDVGRQALVVFRERS